MRRCFQFDMRENTASPRQHAPRAALSSSSPDSHALDLFHDGPRSRESATGGVEVVHLPLADTNEASRRTEQDTPQLLTVSQVARRLGVTCNWVYTHADRLGVYRLGKYLRFSWPRVLERLQR